MATVRDRDLGFKARNRVNASKRPFSGLKRCIRGAAGPGLAGLCEDMLGPTSRDSQTEIEFRRCAPSGSAKKPRRCDDRSDDESPAWAGSGAGTAGPERARDLSKDVGSVRPGSGTGTKKPKSAGERKGSDRPMVVAPKARRVEGMRAMLKSSTRDPARAKERRGNERPTWLKSEAKSAGPERPRLRSGSEKSRYARSSTEAVGPRQATALKGKKKSKWPAKMDDIESEQHIPKTKTSKPIRAELLAYHCEMT